MNKIIIYSIISLISAGFIFWLGYYIGHWHYQTRILKYKLSELVLYIVKEFNLKDDKESANKVLKIISEIGKNK